MIPFSGHHKKPSLCLAAFLPHEKQTNKQKQKTTNHTTTFLGCTVQTNLAIRDGPGVQSLGSELLPSVLWFSHV